MKNHIAKEREVLKKGWQYPTMFTISAKELAEFIKVAARSGDSGGGCLITNVR